MKVVFKANSPKELQEQIQSYLGLTVQPAAATAEVVPIKPPAKALSWGMHPAKMRRLGRARRRRAARARNTVLALPDNTKSPPLPLLSS